MRPYGIIDLHCDTLTNSKLDIAPMEDTLDDPKRVLSFTSMPADVNWAQLYACWLPERLRGEPAIRYYESNRDNFYRQMKKFSDKVSPCETAADIEKAWNEGKKAAVLAIENGSVLAGDLSRVEKLRKDGVRCMTITWNAENEIASGKETQHGMSDFGKEVIPEMEKQGILVDVSHLNDPGFYDLLKVAKKPFVATHSNCRALCGHCRNLTDEQIKEMVSRKCLVGINYYTAFLADDGKVSGPEVIFDHVAHFFDLGAEHMLALGSDNDGCTLPDFLKTPEQVAQLYDYLLNRGLTKEQCDGIFWKNALNFFRENL